MNAAASSTRWMISGFLVSFLGSSILLGSTTGFVAVGLLPVAWIAFYTTLENVEDLLAPLVSRSLGSHDPGRVLVFVELADLLLAAGAVVALLALPTVQLQVFIGYLIVVSILPLIVDVTEELFAARVMSLDATAGTNFLAHLHSLIALVSLVLARPAGALLGTYGYVIVLIVNALTSAVAISLRLTAVRRLVSAAGDSSTAGRQAPVFQEQFATWPRKRVELHAIRAWAGRIIKYRELSPISSLLLAVVNYTVGGYLLIWCVQRLPEIEPAAAVAVLAACAGLGSVAGPQVSRAATRAKRDNEFPTQALLAYATVLVGGLGITSLSLFVSPWASLLFFGLLLFLIALCASAMVTQLATRRAVANLGPDRPFIIGWGQSFSSMGALIGGWSGLALGVASHPAIGLSVAAALAFTMSFLCRKVLGGEST